MGIYARMFATMATYAFGWAIGSRLGEVAWDKAVELKHDRALRKQIADSVEALSPMAKVEEASDNHVAKS